MVGKIFITRSGYDPQLGKHVKDPYLGPNPTLGACRPDVRKQLQQGDHIFVVSGKIPVAPQYVMGGFEIAAIDFRLDEGMLMAPGRAIPRLLARHGLSCADIALYEIHEAFAAQVLANIKAASDPVYRREKAGVDFNLGEFPWDRVNPHGGSLAIGHPFAATGARILSQAAKELGAMAPGSRSPRWSPPTPSTTVTARPARRCCGSTSASAPAGPSRSSCSARTPR